MSQQKQNLQNHVRYVPLYHLVTFGLFVALLVHWVMRAKAGLTMDAAFDIALGLGLGLLTWFARAFPLGVQDRVIRLELRLRMQAIAPAQAARFDELSPGQVTALRFAGDGELAALTQRVLDGALRSNGAIKREIQDWKADDWRI